MEQNDNCIECNKIVKLRQHSINCDSNTSLPWRIKAFYFDCRLQSTQNNKKALNSPRRFGLLWQMRVHCKCNTIPGRDIPVVKNGTSCSSLDTQHTCEPSRIIREPPENAARLPHSREWDRTSRMWKYKKKKNFFFFFFSRPSFLRICMVIMVICCWKAINS